MDTLAAFLSENVEIIIVSIILLGVIFAGLLFGQRDVDDYYTRRGM